jgi:hypothetical protein
MEQKTTKQQLKNKFGKIYMNVLTNKSLNRTDKLTYAVISCKQGSTDSAHLTAVKIADALSADEKTIRRSIKKLKTEGIISMKKTGRWSINHPTNETEHFGLVELCVLASQKLHRNSKLLFIYYRAASSTFGYCSRSRETILKDLGIGNKTYLEAKKDLADLELIKIEIRKAYGKQFTDKVVTTIIPENVDKEMNWPESWIVNEEKHGIAHGLHEITQQQALCALGTVLDNSALQHRTNEHQQKGQLDTSNKSLSNNLINKNTSLIANTAVTKFNDDKINLKIFHSEFDTTKLEDSYADLIKQLFTAIRTATQNYNWRMSNEDFKELRSMVLDYVPDKEAIEDYEWFITEELNPAGRKGNSLAYYLSDGIRMAYVSYHNAQVSGADFNLDDRTTRKNYQMECT